ALAPRAQYLAVGSNDGRLRILSVPELKLFHESTDRHEGVIHAVAFSADGNLLVTGGRDRRVAISQGPSFKTILLLPRTNSSVLHVAFSPQGRLLAVSGQDNLIKVWDLRMVQKHLRLLGLDWDGGPQAVPTKPLQPAKVMLIEAPASRAHLAAELRHQAAELYRKASWPELLKVAQKALEADTAARQPHWHLGMAHIMCDEYEKGSKVFESMIARFPDDLEALERLAGCRYALGAAQEAVDLCDKILRVEPDRASTCNLLAWIHTVGPES